MSILRRIQRGDWNWLGRNRHLRITISVERGHREHIYKFAPPLDSDLDAEISAQLAKVPGVKRIMPIRLMGAEESAILIGYGPGGRADLLDRIVRRVIRVVTNNDAVLAKS